MNELHSYYRTRVTGLAVGIALAALLGPTVLYPWLVGLVGINHWLPQSMKVITSRLALVCYLAGGEWLIRKHLWRFERKEWDFKDVWEATTFYTNTPIGAAPVPFESSHKVRIEQDALFMKIAPTEGEHYINWGSLALQLIDKDKVVYAYWVKYRNDERFPKEGITVKGLEEMDVTERDSDGRPIRLTGTFAHCPEGQSPVYTGRVEFNRRPKEVDED